MQKLEYKVLAVDDETSVLNSLQRATRLHGIKMLTASSAAKGLALLEKEEFHIVISDMQMPEMDGTEFLKIVRDKYPLLRRILLTGYADLGSTIRSVNEGGIHVYLEKPWDNPELIELLNEQHNLYLKDATLYKAAKEAKAVLKTTRNLLIQNDQYSDQLKKAEHFTNLTHDKLIQDHRGTMTLLRQMIRLQEPELGVQIESIERWFNLFYPLLPLTEECVYVISDAIQLFPIGRFFSNQYSEQDPYSLRQAELTLASVSHLASVGVILNLSRERYDGTGPLKLAGENIPLIARVFSLMLAFSEKLLISKTDVAAITVMQQQNRSHQILDPKLTSLLYEFINKQSPSRNRPLKHLKLNKLLPQMTIAEDIYSEQGLLLLAKYTVLTEKLIDVVATYESIHKTNIVVAVYE